MALRPLLSFIGGISIPLYFVGLGLFAIVTHVPSSMLPRRLFALTFASSGALLLLVLLEVYGGIPAQSRWLLWRLHLGVDLVLIIFILPHVLLSLTLHRLLDGWGALTIRISHLLILTAWLYLFQQVGEAFPTRGRDTGYDTPVSTLLSHCLSRAGVFGVCLSALMSGIGAVAGLSISLRRLFHVDDPAEIDEAQRGLVCALQRLAKHRKAMP